MKCKDCINYKKSVDSQYHIQQVGKCKLITEILKMNNAYLIYAETLNVLDEFGCNMFKQRNKS